MGRRRSSRRASAPRTNRRPAGERRPGAGAAGRCSSNRPQPRRRAHRTHRRHPGVLGAGQRLGLLRRPTGGNVDRHQPRRRVTYHDRVATWVESGNVGRSRPLQRRAERSPALAPDRLRDASASGGPCHDHVASRVGCEGPAGRVLVLGREQIRPAQGAVGLALAEGDALGVRIEVGGRAGHRHALEQHRLACGVDRHEARVASDRRHRAEVGAGATTGDVRVPAVAGLRQVDDDRVAGGVDTEAARDRGREDRCGVREAGVDRAGGLPDSLVLGVAHRPGRRRSTVVARGGRGNQAAVREGARACESAAGDERGRLDGPVCGIPARRGRRPGDGRAADRVHCDGNRVGTPLGRAPGRTKRPRRREVARRCRRGERTDREEGDDEDDATRTHFDQTVLLERAGGHVLSPVPERRLRQGTRGSLCASRAWAYFSAAGQTIR